MMMLRWTAAGVLKAEHNFRTAAGYHALPKLVAALQAHDAAINLQRRVDNRKRVLNDYRAATQIQQGAGHCRV